MRDFFFQIALFLAGTFIGIAAPLLQKKEHQKLVARILGILLVAISLIWAGYELGNNGSALPVVTNTSPDAPATNEQTDGTTYTPTPMPTAINTPQPIATLTPIPLSSPATHTPLPPVQVLLFDNFDNPAYHQGYNTELWGCDRCEIGSVTHDKGSVRFPLCHNR